MEWLTGIALGLATVLATWLFFYIMVGICKICLYRDRINFAFARDPKPFKPNQRWLVKTLMFLFWPKIKWEDEVFYYDRGYPDWKKRELAYRAIGS